MDKPADYMPEDVIMAAEETVQSLEGINQYPIEWTLAVSRAILKAKNDAYEAAAQFIMDDDMLGNMYMTPGGAEAYAKAIRRLKTQAS